MCRYEFLKVSRKPFPEISDEVCTEIKHDLKIVGGQLLMEVGYGMDFDMMDEGLKMDQSRNILQRMGAPGDKRSQVLLL